MPDWCTMTVIDGSGRRHSLDVYATSSYDAAHLYLTHVINQPTCGLPRPTVETIFEVVANGRVLRVDGKKLKRWIKQRRQEWKGPRGMLFSQRPVLD